MGRPRSRRLLVGVAVTATALVASVAVTRLLPDAVAEPSGATGFASVNGGTTGGAGGPTVRATTGTEILAALCGRDDDDSPLVIEVEGTITHDNTAPPSGGSCATTDGEISLGEVANVSVVGVGGGAVFDRIGIHVYASRNVVLQNLTVRDVRKDGDRPSNDGDAIGMQCGVRNVWVDHVSLEADGGEDEGFDSLFDLKDDTRYVTLSYSTLRSSGRAGLIGSSDEDTSSSFITFHHNLYQDIGSRTPLLRGGVAHSYDNWFVRVTKSGINVRAGGRIKVEDNYFEDSRDVLGTFYEEETQGSWEASGNVYDGGEWSQDGPGNQPAGPEVVSTTTVDIPYEYVLDDASCVPDVVGSTAGAGTGLATSPGGCSGASQAPQEPAPQEPTPPEPTPPEPAPQEPAPQEPPAAPEQGAAPGANLSRADGADADGTSKAQGTSFRDVRDGDLTTAWSPVGSNGWITVKWDAPRTVSTVRIRELRGSYGTVTSWRIVDGTSGDELARGTRSGWVRLPPTELTRLTLQVLGASGTPRIAELETYR